MGIGTDMRDKNNIRRELTRDSIEPATYIMFGDETIYLWVSNIRATTKDLDDDILIWDHPVKDKWDQYKWAGDNSHSSSVTYVWNKDNEWEEKVYNTLYLDSINTTAKFDTTNHYISSITSSLTSNGSFEISSGQDNFQDWTITKNTQNDSGVYYAQSTNYVTDQTYSVYGFMGYASVYVGTQVAYMSQDIDLTTVTEITFDCKTDRIEHGEIAFYIDTTKEWSTVTGYTEYPNQTIDVSGYTGTHTIKLYHTCSGPYLKYARAYWDNVRLVSGANSKYYSREVYKGTHTVYSVTVSATEYKPAGTDIDWYVSTDGGTNWETITLDTEKVLNSGNELRIRADLTVTGSGIPTATDIQVKYTFA